MVKKVVSWSLMLLYFFNGHAHSSSFLMPRSVTHNATLECALDTYQIYRDPTAACSSWQFYATPFYMQSNNSQNLARSLLPNNAANLNIQENGSGNVGSLWLNLIAPPGLFYSSTLTISPASKTAGSYLYGRVAKGDFWFSVSLAAMSVKHTLNEKETLTGDAVYGTIPGITTGIQAFNNQLWRYGKLNPRALTRSGIDDIQLKLGTNNYFCNDALRFGFYVVGTVPTGNAPRAEFLFEPLVGTKHGAIGFGIMGDYTCPLNLNQQWSLLYDFKYRYLFSGQEIRSFDLLPNGDWSRYMLLVNSLTTSVSFPAINRCTAPAKVRPGSQIEYWLAAHYAYCAWNVELGYNLWWRAKDSISLLCPFPTDTGIFDLAGAVANNPISASRANISQSAIGPNQAPSDAVFTPSSALNCASAAQQSTATNSLYLAFSYNGATCSGCNDAQGYEWLIGIGGGYEWANRQALAQGSVWSKLGILF